MIEHLFAVMNEVLDQISAELPAARGVRRQQLMDQLRALRSMSGSILDEWMVLEEKLAYCHQLATCSVPMIASGIPEEDDTFSKGLGYYQLMMFPEAIRFFEAFVRRNPDSPAGRLYLALSYLHNRNYDDAYRHFQILLPLTNDGKIKAMSCHAMACIQQAKQNADKAEELFRLADEYDTERSGPHLQTDPCPGKEGNP